MINIVRNPCGCHYPQGRVPLCLAKIFTFGRSLLIPSSENLIGNFLIVADGLGNNLLCSSSCSIKQYGLRYFLLFIYRGALGEKRIIPGGKL